MIARDDIAKARQLIAPHVRQTPVIQVAIPGFDVPVTLKLEHLQLSGSFKARGAFTNLLMRPVPPAGVAAASGGNHGAAVALAASRLGHRARIFVPEISSPAKIALIRQSGADLVITGARYSEAAEACEDYMAETGAMSVHAYDAVETLMGQGTLAAELADQAPEAETLLVAVGGGGLIGGIAAWTAGERRIIAVEPEHCPTLERALAAGEPVDVTPSGVAADSLGASRIGALMFPYAQQHIDAAVLVSDDAIRQAQVWLWNELRLVAEPGGATALAAVLGGRYKPAPGERIAVIVCGGNTDPATFAKLF